jgi:hypothetical protein
VRGNEWAARATKKKSRKDLKKIWPTLVRRQSSD